MDDPVLVARQLASSNRAVEGARLLERSTADGVANAALELATWRLTGEYIRRDLAMARDYFIQAADLGLAPARPIAIAMLGNGAGGTERRWSEALQRLGAERDPLSREIASRLAEMSIDANGRPQASTSGKVVIDDPEVRSFRSFLSPDECALLIQCASALFQPSVVVHPTSGQMVRDPVRTSEVASFPFVLENPFVHAINQRIAAATGSDVDQGEPLQVLRYSPGQQYKLHCDALPGQTNQRRTTFLVYLSDGFGGGHTVFPDLGLRYRGEVGDALAFSSLRRDGTIHPLARHAGEPVTNGQKYLLSRWIRQRALDLSGPPGRPL